MTTGRSLAHELLSACGYDPTPTPRLTVNDLGRVVDQLRADGRGDYQVSLWLEGLTPEADKLQGVLDFSLRQIEVPGEPDKYVLLTARPDV